MNDFARLLDPCKIICPGVRILPRLLRIQFLSAGSVHGEISGVSLGVGYAILSELDGNLLEKAQSQFKGVKCDEKQLRAISHYNRKQGIAQFSEEQSRSKDAQTIDLINDNKYNQIKYLLSIYYRFRSQ